MTQKDLDLVKAIGQGLQEFKIGPSAYSGPVFRIIAAGLRKLHPTLTNKDISAYLTVAPDPTNNGSITVMLQLSDSAPAWVEELKHVLVAAATDQDVEPGYEQPAV